MKKDSLEHTEELENNLGIVGSASSRLGSRKSQQDAYYLSTADPGCVLAVLCDGMGGMEGGELASQTAVRAFVRDFEKIRNKEDNFYDFLREEVDAVDQLVSSRDQFAGVPGEFQENEKKRRRLGMVLGPRC